jgi:hypothetical protein
MDQQAYNVLAAIIAGAIATQWDRINGSATGRRAGSPADDRPNWRYRPRERRARRPGPSWGTRMGEAWGRWRIRRRRVWDPRST